MKKFTRNELAIIAVAILVPVLLFVRWKMAPKPAPAQQTDQTAAASAAPAPDQGGQPAPVPADPTSSATAVSAAPLPPAQPGMPSSGDVAGAPVPVPPPSPAAAGQQPMPQQQMAGAIKMGQTSPGQTDRVTYNPKSTRDPTLSAEDLERLKQEELKYQQQLADQERRRKEEAQAAIKRAEHAKWMQRPEAILEKLDLQAVIGGGAIINQKVVRVGSVVDGAKIIRITPDYVDVFYKGKTLRKSMGK